MNPSKNPLPRPDTEATGETILALSTVPVALVAGAALTMWFAYLTRRDDGSSDAALWRGCAITMAVITVLIAVGFWWGMYPWRAEYHEWRGVVGEVERVDSRLVPNGSGGMEEKIVVTYRGNPTQYGVLDTRAASVKPGDELAITCVRRWQWSGTHGYDCNFVESRGAS